MRRVGKQVKLKVQLPPTCIIKGGKRQATFTQHRTDVVDTTNFFNVQHYDVGITHPQAGKHGNARFAAGDAMWAGKHRMYEGLKYAYDTDDPLTPWPLRAAVRPLIMETYGTMHPEFLALLKQLSNDIKVASPRGYDPSAKASF